MHYIRFAKDYFWHRFKAKNRHGVHSPFVYSLVDTVIYDVNKKKVYTEVENIRRKALNKSQAKSKSPKLAQLLYRLTASAAPKNIIVIGAEDAISILYLQKAAPAATIYVLEASAQTAAAAKAIFDEIAGAHINLQTGDPDIAFPKVLNTLSHLDVVYICNGQGGQSALKYLHYCLPRAQEGTMLVFDGIYSTQEMKQAWRQIKANPQVKVTIDLFYMGLVFFRKGQVKEDFMIKV